MSAHCSVHSLSGFLDDVLKPREREGVEIHLAQCPGCREQLAGLRKVVRELRRLESEAPPADLGSRIERGIQLGHHPTGLGERTESRVRGLFEQTSLLPLFGVIIALCVLSYLLAIHFERAGQEVATQVIVAPGGGPVGASTEVREVLWAGRTFHKEAWGWREEGLPDEAPVSIIDLTDGALGRWQAPEIVRPLAGSVRFRLGDQIVEVIFPPLPTEAY